ncbi:small ribosomal subunit protein mS39 [Halyomorpha halys]|uniref:small ribosomal subunit protein mS39 n=1 Tax=Halyomorpha halys TaxID=286706 RepID=UPI0006D501A5|nr:protein PTCD3 homolog, mitochondrial [Halyomorpha halys]
MKYKYLLRTVQKYKISYQRYSTEVDIDIPKRIPRGPTDILKALSSTVKRDPTAPQYKYHDDPYLIPYSNFTKRSYALSQESGRKAARWIRQQHKKLFQHKIAEPLIEAFLPTPEYNEDSEVDEEILKKLIKNGFVSDTLFVYKLLKSKNIDITPSTKQSLLEFVCFSNEEESLSEDWINERWYIMSTKNQKESKTWKDGSLAEQLFYELKSDMPSSYSAIICGMCKYFQVSKAFEIYSEAQSKNITLNVEAYNALISRAKFANESHPKIWELIMTLLNEMADRKIKPNVKTLNSILESLSKMTTNRNAIPNALHTLAEFKSLNIEPCLTSYYYLLEIFSRNKEQLNGALHAILDYAADKHFTMNDKKDILFFAKAMEICSKLRNKDLIYRIHQLVFTGNNYNLIGDSFNESVYYRYFFYLLTDVEELSKIMEFYDDFVPNIYVPEPSVINAILKVVGKNMAWDLLPKLWSDIVLFEQFEISGVMENILETASQNVDEHLMEDMSKIAWSAWEKIEGLKRERSSFQWSASALGNILLILLKNGEKSKANLIINKLIQLGSSAINEPKIEALSLYIESCIENSSPDVAIKCIQYCSDVGFMETTEFARRINSSIELSPQQYERLASIVGEDCLKVEKKKDQSS